MSRCIDYQHAWNLVIDFLRPRDFHCLFLKVFNREEGCADLLCDTAGFIILQRGECEAVL